MSTLYLKMSFSELSFVPANSTTVIYGAHLIPLQYLKEVKHNACQSRLHLKWKHTILFL